MQLLKYRSSGSPVRMLQELLNEAGYILRITSYFGGPTEKAVKDFQIKNNLVSDGIVYTKTWTALANKVPEGRNLRESDLIDLAHSLEVEVAAIRAVTELESSGRGFLNNGLPKILFEGHIFWRQLKQSGYDPAALQKGYEDVLYSKWTGKYYYGGEKEWERLTRAISILSEPEVAEAAYASASYGLFQIMGFHYKSLGYDEILRFVADMRKNERRQLQVFGKFLEVNHLVPYLKNHQWAAFAKGYNGPDYKKNDYDTKLAKAYEKYA